jgi:phosphosulfolactate synthase
MTKGWEPLFPEARARSRKPRKSGVTMILDKCHGLRAAGDLMDTAGDYIDHWKFSYGTSAFLDEELLRQKIALAREQEILVYPGGTLVEYAILQGKCRDYLRKAVDLGFNGVEISDGTIDYSRGTRHDAIRFALDLGLIVVAEVGKKDPAQQLPPEKLAEQALADFDSGAAWVVVEARESGRGVGVFDDDGAVVTSHVDTLVRNLGEHQSRLIWEAPFKSQQEYFILRFGPEVCLGNIPPREVLSLEAMRSSLRFETFRHLVEGRSEEEQEGTEAAADRSRA